MNEEHAHHRNLTHMEKRRQKTKRKKAFCEDTKHVISPAITTTSNIRDKRIGGDAQCATLYGVQCGHCMVCTNMKLTNTQTYKKENGINNSNANN